MVDFFVFLLVFSFVSNEVICLFFDWVIFLIGSSICFLIRSSLCFLIESLIVKIY